MNKYSLNEQSGAGLIEVLVTVLILATSLMALAALQTRSLQFNQSAYFRSQANVYAYDILDRIRSNTSNLAGYNIAEADFNLGSPVVNAPLVNADLDAWRRNIATYLPNGKGYMTCTVATRMCTINIKWDELGSAGQANEDTTTLFSFTTRI